MVGPFLRSLTLLLVLSSAACTNLPDARDARGLYIDLHKSVEYQSSVDSWAIDEFALDELRSHASLSVCTAPEGAAEELGRWINAQFDELIEPGASDLEQPARLVYEREGDTRHFSRMRRLERVRMLLDLVSASRADCPYWLEEDSDFAGVEPDEGRVVILGESLGGGSVRFSDGEAAFGGGAGGRLMLGYGFSTFTLALGAEVGADGYLPESEDGGRSFAGVFATGVPLLFRHTDISRVYDVTLSYRTLWTDEPRHGFRVELGFGLTTPRVSGLLPYGLLWVGYEVFPSQGSTEHAILLGTRVGFDWDP